MSLSVHSILSNRELDIKTKGSLGESNYPVNDLYLIKERGNWYIYKGYVGNYY